VTNAAELSGKQIDALLYYARQYRAVLRDDDPIPHGLSVKALVGRDMLTPDSLHSLTNLGLERVRVLFAWVDSDYVRRPHPREQHENAALRVREVETAEREAHALHAARLAGGALVGHGYVVGGYVRSLRTHLVGRVAGVVGGPLLLVCWSNGTESQVNVRVLVPADEPQHQAVTRPSTSGPTSPTSGRPVGTAPTYRELSALAYVLRYGRFPDAAPADLVTVLTGRGWVHRRTRRGRQVMQVSALGMAWLWQCAAGPTRVSIGTAHEQAITDNAGRRAVPA
jgi:hypothetical protein